jgi:hypothetical protein
VAVSALAMKVSIEEKVVGGGGFELVVYPGLPNEERKPQPIFEVFSGRNFILTCVMGK